MIIAQVVTATRRVKAVVEMLDPVPAAPAGVEFVPVADFSAAGKFHIAASNPASFVDVLP